MSGSGPGCVKTCTSQERAKLFSLLPVPDSVCQCSCFPNRQNRNGISTRKLNVGVFTQPGSDSDTGRVTKRCLLYPHEQTSRGESVTSVSCQQRTSPKFCWPRP